MECFSISFGHLEIEMFALSYLHLKHPTINVEVLQQITKWI